MSRALISLWVAVHATDSCYHISTTILTHIRLKTCQLSHNTNDWCIGYVCQLIVTRFDKGGAQASRTLNFPLVVASCTTNMNHFKKLEAATLNIFLFIYTPLVPTNIWSCCGGGLNYKNNVIASNKKLTDVTVLVYRLGFLPLPFGPGIRPYFFHSGENP